MGITSNKPKGGLEVTSCMAVKENICAYLDNELGADDRLMFEAHLESCPACRRELDEMREIISLCTSLPQQELPDGFREELHEKLLAVADGYKSNVKSIVKPGKTKHIRMITSIAAGLLLIFLTGSLLKYGFFQTGLTAKNSENMAMSAAQAPERAAAKAQPEGAAADGAAVDSAAGSAEPADATGSVPGIMSFGKALEAPLGTEADRSVAAKDRSTAAAYATSMPVEETVTNKVSTITITADEPGAAIEKIASLALENNGELKVQSVFTAGATPEERGNGSPNAAIAKSSGTETGQPLNYIIPSANYDKFISSINGSFGAANVQSGALVTEDMTATINEEMKRSDEIDAELQQLQQDNEKNADRIDSLKKEKEDLDNRIETLRLNSDFVTVTIYIYEK